MLRKFVPCGDQGDGL